MSTSRRIVAIVIVATAWLTSCQRAPQALPPPGGLATQSALGDRTFVLPKPTLDRAAQLRFWTGFALFRDPWVRAPASTTARDGLGPLFNARSCIACHAGGGRGTSLRFDANAASTVFRTARHGALHTWGSQLQPRATYDMTGQAQRTRGFFAGEPSPTVEWQAEDDGLQAIRLHVAEYPDLSLSARIAPSLVGVGLLGEIADSAFIALADERDRDGDGISGRVHRLEDGAIGRFGWKAEHASVARQTASAFAQDMGITSELVPTESCTESQLHCLRQPSGKGPVGDVEINADLFAYVVEFTAALPVPAARPVTARVAAGRKLFYAAGCHDCHTPSHSIEQAGLVDTIWPYTDLLLHDMGGRLADTVQAGNAAGSEWRTAPLWGLGAAMALNPKTGLLHDGRARSVHEAILWHGGEAKQSNEIYQSFTNEQQQALSAFVQAL